MSRLHLLTRSASTLIRVLEFLISGLILAIFSYFLAKLHNRADSSIPNWERAVEGMSGAATLYTIFAVMLTCFLGGITFFAFIAVVLDVCFCGCFVATAVLTRGGHRSCRKTGDNSPIGVGHHTSCQLQRVVFAISIAGAFLFLVSAVLQVALSRTHKREKRYGPSPSNDYTSGSGKRKFPWSRKPKSAGEKDGELGAMGAGAFAAGEVGKHHRDRQSDVTGTTVATDTYGGPNSKYAEPTGAPTQPGGGAGYGQYPAQQQTGTTTTAAPAADGYENRTYGSGYNDTSTAYAPSTGAPASATGHTSGGAPAGFHNPPRSPVQEMDGGAGGAGQTGNVVYESNPYAEVHQGGYLHTNPEGMGYAR